MHKPMHEASGSDANGNTDAEATTRMSVIFDLNESTMFLQLEAAQSAKQPVAEASGSDAANDDNDQSTAETVKSGETEPHVSSEDEGEEIISGTIDKKVPSASQQESGRPASGPRPSNDTAGNTFWPPDAVTSASSCLHNHQPVRLFWLLIF